MQKAELILINNVANSSYFDGISFPHLSTTQKDSAHNNTKHQILNTKSLGFAVVTSAIKNKHIISLIL